MKKKSIRLLEAGSAAQVVAHGQRQRSLGKRFSMTYKGILNPEKAYVAAEKDLCLGNIKDITEMQFLYPISRQFPFDDTCEKIVRELEKRNWRSCS